jgi:hypothetical protein
VSHLPRLEDLDGLDIRFLPPAAGIAFGQLPACRPVGVAAGHDTLGPELARRVRGEVDHNAVRVDADCAAALVDLAAGIDGLKLDEHDHSVMKQPASADRQRVLPNLASARNCTVLPVGLLRFLVAWPRPGDLLF